MEYDIIMIGTAKEIEKYIEIIECSCRVVAAIDLLDLEQGLANYEHIRIEDINSRQFDRILLVCEKAFKEILYPVLTGSLAIASERISGLEFIDELKYRQDRERYIQLYEAGDGIGGNFQMKVGNEYKMLSDYREDAGAIDMHYFFQDMIVASHIASKKVLHHWDIGSRLDGFISHLLTCGIHTTVIDIRPFRDINIGYGVAKLDFIQEDATNLDRIESGSIESLSALHSIEHFGLGRYGDEINPDAWRIAMLNMERVLAVNGALYLSVPVGREEKLCFNAHRIFHPRTICNTLKNLKIEAMYLIHNGTVNLFDAEEVARESYLDQMGGYDCGIFVFIKSEGNEHSL